MTDSPDGWILVRTRLMWARVEIVLVGDQLDPLEVSRQLGLQPSRGFLKGDQV